MPFWGDTTEPAPSKATRVNKFEKVPPVVWLCVDCLDEARLTKKT